MKRAALVATLGVLALWPGRPAADTTVSGSVVQRTDVVVDRSGVEFEYSVRRLNAVPPVLTRLVVQLPVGTRFHPERFPRCGIGTIVTRGPSECPPGSRIGAGTVAAQSSVYPKGVAGRVTAFNGRRLAGSRRVLLVYVKPKLGVSFVLVGKWRGTRARGLRLELLVPVPKTLAGIPEPLLTDLALRLDARRESALLVRAPCAATYRFTADYLYEGALTSSDRAQCDASG